MPRTPAVLVLAALALASCGGGDERPRIGEQPQAPRGADGDAVVVAWFAAVRRGDAAGAARLFALPAVVANGGGPQRLSTRRQAAAFGASLPCGAVPRRIVRHHGYRIVEVRLVERPGGACGEATGSAARVAIRLRGGRIAEWVRLPAGRLPAPEDELPAGPLV